MSAIEFIDEIKGLQHFLKTNQKDSQDHRIDVLEADILWNASEFVARVLAVAEPLKYECTVDEFNDFLNQYERDHEAEIDVDRLFKKFWLRNVLGFVHMAGVIRAACRGFDKIKNHRKETQFFTDFYLQNSSKGKKVTLEKVKSAVDEFEHEHSVELNREFLFRKNGWLYEKDDGWDMASMDIYYAPYLTHWNDFSFLNAFRLFKSDKDNGKGLKIEKRAFENIHSAHSAYFTKTPTIDWFLQQENVLLDREIFYQLEFYHAKPNYWHDLADEIAAAFWRLLLDDENFDNDEKRIQHFISQTYWTRRGDLLKGSTEEARVRFLNAAIKLVLNDEDLKAVDNEFRKIELDERMPSYEIHIVANEKGMHNHLKPDYSDFFELHESLRQRDKLAHKAFLVGQKSRSHSWFLLQSIVVYDKEFAKIGSERATNFPRIFQLLQASIERPVLIWYVTYCITWKRPEVIPYFFFKKDFISLGFKAIEQISYREESPKENIRLEVWSKSLHLALQSQREIKDDLDLVAKIVFQIYRQLQEHKYDLPNRNLRCPHISLIIMFRY